ncbi:MAG: ABC transporter substrate-binding protein, partial [Dehalococcoidales bacterium]|nr:ABC transporter substrate-binding protein [Dehalococcoidales bacterium]
ESLWGWSFYDSLIRWDANSKFIPHVAESWSVSEDGCTWTFKIRKGIKFHNGDPLTAHDVKFSVDRFGDMSLSKNPWSYYISQAYNKVETRVLDDYTFQFVSARPEPSQQIVFAWTRILPKNYYEKVGMEEFRKKPVGSGPWKFKELITKQKMVLEANTDYWIPEEIPAYQYYVELMVPEQATRIAMLKNGECDIAYGIDYDRLADLQKEGFKIMKQPGPPGTSSLCIQGSWLPDAGPVGDIRVRQALSYALNREEIVEQWYQGYGDPTAGQFYMYPGCFGWGENLRNDPYDPDKAKALLREAGYPGKWADPTIHIYTTAAGQDYILLLMGYWEDVGLKPKMEVVDSTIYTSYFFNFNRIKEGDPNVGWIFTWTYQSFFNCMYHSSNMYTSWGTHNVGNDPKADELYLKAANERNIDLAAKYFNEFQAYVKSLYWNIGICTFDTLIVYNPKTIGEWKGRNWVSLQDALNGIKHP